jgi:hypothetical protein
MRKLFKTLAAASLALAGMPQAAPAQIVSADAADPWKLSQTPESCFLERSFGSGASKTDLIIQSFGSSTPYHVLVRGAGLPLRPQRAVSAQVGFAGEKSAKEALVLLGKSGDAPMMVIVASPPRPFPVNFLAWLYRGVRTQAEMIVPIATSNSELSINLAGSGPIDLDLGAMAGEYSRLDTCADAIEHKWSMAAAKDGGPTDAPKTTPETFKNWQVKYPPNLLLARISGLVELRMTVDASGRAHDCTVQMATWSPGFGEHACADLQEYGHFEPAHDAQGKPVSALFRTGVMYMIYDW